MVVCSVLVAIGIALLFAAQTKWREQRVPDAWALGIFGGLLCLTSAGLVAPMQRAVARARERLRREEAKPSEPWTWEPAWTDASGIPNSGRRNGGAMLFCGVLAIALSLPGVFALSREMQRGNHAILLVLLFPLVGSGLLLAVALDAWRRRKYGTARFVPAALPLPLGGEIAGMILVTRPVHAERPGRVSLDCWQTTLTRHGNKRRQREESIAHVEREIDAAAWMSTAGESRIFVQLPARGGSVTTMTPLTQDQPTYEWRLRAQVPTPGADFVAEFVLPVFVVAGASGGANHADAGAGDATSSISKLAERAEVWRAAGVREEPQPDALGGMALVLPAGEARRHLAGPLITTLIFAGVAVALSFSPVPVVIVVFVGLFGLLPLVALLALLQPGGERVWVERDALCTQSVKGIVRRLPLTEIEVLEQRLNVGVGNRQFFRVQARERPTGTRKFGKRFEVASLVPGHEPAAHVVVWLRERIPAAR